MFAGVTFDPGTILGIQYGPVLHTVLITACGTVLHSSKANGHVAEESLHSVVGNNATVVLGKVDYVTLQIAEARGRARLGEKWLPWRNCEHFVSEICTGASQSPQLVFWLIIAVALGFAVSRGMK